jgi:hypothetical protein
MSYNGWTNYETWCVKLWLDNEEGSYLFMKDLAIQAADDHSDDKDDAVSAMANQIKDHIEEFSPRLEGLYADLLQAALSEVNWYEMAESYIDEFCEDKFTEQAVEQD